MPVLSSIAAGGAAASQIPGVSEKVGDVIGAGKDLLGGLGIGGPAERRRSLPRGVPSSLKKGITLGRLHAGVPGDPGYSNTAPLYAGLTAYDFLSSNGLHDEISHIEITEPAEVTMYSGVENGMPAGASYTVQGPTTVTAQDLKREGIHDEISSIAARPLGEGRGQTGSGAGGTGEQGPGVTAAGAGGNQSLMILVLGAALLLIANQ